ncbi:hypothetical protein DM02DRAFT_677590 [Periconia macrospinosa]|uniref:Uncharacterized protein n=1 Tax=Periconia macrospinosa TaxID=97972 RepID=A0A2V1D2N9_9PLEO|nr:hypothetical protein DM02DRAFT_677590 [Periconia macrospinosa]
MRSAIVISLITGLTLGVPTPNPREIGLGIPAVVVDGHPIKVPAEKRSLANDLGVNSKISIGSHTVEAGGGAVSIGGHATGGSVGNDPGSSITIHTKRLDPSLSITSGLLNARSKERGISFISGASAIGIGTSAIGGNVPIPGKDGSGVANGGKGGDALVPNSRAGNGGDGGIIIL